MLVVQILGGLVIVGIMYLAAMVIIGHKDDDDFGTGNPNFI